jgi:hypothetical protein
MVHLYPNSLFVFYTSSQLIHVVFGIRIGWPWLLGGLVYNKSEALGTSVQVQELRRLMRSH